MSLSLRVRVLLLIAGGYAGMFALGGIYLYRLQMDFHDRVLAVQNNHLSDAVRSEDYLIDEAGPEDFNVRTILSFDTWTIIDDAVVVGRTNLTRRGGGKEIKFDEALAEGGGSLERGKEDRITPEGIYVNPAGATRRPPDFDSQVVLGAIWDAMARGENVRAAGGLAMPIVKRGAVRGGCWLRREQAVVQGVLLELLPAFVLSTLLLGAVMYWIMGRLVVKPIEALAGGARRVRDGDLTVRREEPARTDDLADLVRSFNQMTATVQGFNARLEEEVERATDLARRAEAAAMTQRRLAAMGELAAGIAHEINNPLGGMINAVEVLGRDDLPETRRTEYRALVARGLERIGETVHRLRRFTPRDAPHEPVELSGVVQDSLDLIRHRAGRLGVALGWTPPAPGPAPAVQGAANEIGQSVLNLLANALDALEEKGTRDPKGPRIDVELTWDEAAVILRVGDNGPGVTEEELARVSDLFYTTKEVGKGTGLGLALVHTAMRKHRGRIAITSEPGAFFRVELRFPRFGRREEA